MRNSANSRGGVTFDQVFRAIGDPHRLQIMQLLREREMSAGEILDALDVVQSTLSHHMKSLVDAGAVNARRSGKWTYYSINEKAMSDAAALLEEYAQGTKLFLKADQANGRSTTDQRRKTPAESTSVRSDGKSVPRSAANAEKAAVKEGKEKKSAGKAGAKEKKEPDAGTVKEEKKSKKARKSKKSKK